MEKDEILSKEEFRAKLDEREDSDHEYWSEIKRFNWLTLYETTRHYGGPEEGGWYYNWNEPSFSLEIDRDFEFMYEVYLYLCNSAIRKSTGNIYSVSGGSNWYVAFEMNLNDQATKEKPYYE